MVACDHQHLRQLVEQYRARPFVEAELWAGKVRRAVDGNRDRRIDDAILVELTGLTIEQVRVGIAWHNDRARVVREHGGLPPDGA